MAKDLKVLAEYFAGESAKVTVAANEKPRVEGNHIYLPAGLEGPEQYAMIAGLIHETGHMRYSSKTIGQEMKQAGEMHQFVFNICEDIRVDQKAFEKYPNAPNLYRELLKMGGTDRLEFAKTLSPSMQILIQSVINNYGQEVSRDFSILGPEAKDWLEKHPNFYEEMTKQVVEVSSYDEYMSLIERITKELALTEKDLQPDLGGEGNQAQKEANEAKEQATQAQTKYQEASKNLQDDKQELYKMEQQYGNEEEPSIKENIKEAYEKKKEEAFKHKNEAFKSEKEAHQQEQKAEEKQQEVTAKIGKKLEEHKDKLDQLTVNMASGRVNYEHIQTSVGERLRTEALEEYHMPEHVKDTIYECIRDRCETSRVEEMGRLNQTMLPHYLTKPDEIFVDQHYENKPIHATLMVDVSGSMGGESSNGSGGRIAYPLMIAVAKALEEASGNGFRVKWAMELFGDGHKRCKDFEQDPNWKNIYQHMEGHASRECLSETIQDIEKLEYDPRARNIAIVMTDGGLTGDDYEYLSKKRHGHIEYVFFQIGENARSHPIAREIFHDRVISQLEGSEQIVERGLTEVLRR